MTPSELSAALIASGLPASTMPVVETSLGWFYIGKPGPRWRAWIAEREAAGQRVACVETVLEALTIASSWQIADNNARTKAKYLRVVR